MPPINKDHANSIAKKLGAIIDTGKKAHDIACVYHKGVLIATFGIRRGSDRNLGHGHIPKDLHLSPRQTLLLAQCPMSLEQWLDVLRDGGWLDDDETDEDTPGDGQET
jgi:hypothetical protein